MDTTGPRLLSLVIPVFNEEETISPLLDRVRLLVDHLQDLRVEVIFVDDHSTDHTPQLLRGACGEDGSFRYLRLAANCGSHIAVLAGLEHCQGDCAVFLAADLQDPPELVPKMIEQWRQGNHVVWAIREKREGLSLSERACSKLFYWLARRMGGIQMPPTGSDFALLDRKVIDALLASVGHCASLGGAIARLGFVQGQVPYVKEPRRLGVSKWSLEKKLRAFADTFVAFSYRPLRLMSYCGMLCSLLGFLYAILVILLRVTAARPIMGWTSIMVAILVLGGIQMVMLGVIGEYLWRTLEEARGRPRYIVEDRYPAKSALRERLSRTEAREAASKADLKPHRITG